jgi:hypothetical protein
LRAAGRPKARLETESGHFTARMINFQSSVFHVGACEQQIRC